jgi:hypothetical protein
MSPALLLFLLLLLLLPLLSLVQYRCEKTPLYGPYP